MFIDTRIVVDIIESLDWYSINRRGELVHGAENEHKALFKAEDVLRAIHNLDKTQD